MAQETSAAHQLKEKHMKLKLYELLISDAFKSQELIVII